MGTQSTTDCAASRVCKSGGKYPHPRGPASIAGDGPAHESSGRPILDGREFQVCSVASACSNDIETTIVGRGCEVVRLLWTARRTVIALDPPNGSILSGERHGREVEPRPQPPACPRQVDA